MFGIRGSGSPRPGIGGAVARGVGKPAHTLPQMTNAPANANAADTSEPVRDVSDCRAKSAHSISAASSFSFRLFQLDASLNPIHIVANAPAAFRSNVASVVST